MNIPTTTTEKPYIEFRFNEKGKLTKLSTTNIWWGGINGGFTSNKYEGNTCEPKDLGRYINAYKLRKVREIEKEIKSLTNKLNNMKRYFKF